MYDLIVIGAGPGGYVAAIKAAQLGMKTAVIEKSSVGGTCLNRGCIPTKTLLHASELAEALKHGENCGIKTGELSIDMAKLYSQKNNVVEKLVAGIEGLLKGNDITLINGVAQIVGPHEVKAGDEIIKGENILLATGSVPSLPPIKGSDLPNVITSDALLASPPDFKRLVIVGGGVIGVEFASVFNALGCEITIVEACDGLLPNFDKEISKKLALSLKKKGIAVHTKASVSEIKEHDGALACVFSSKGKEMTAACDQVLIATGRKASVAEAFAEGFTCEMERGAIKVNEKFQTSVPSIYGIGDAVFGTIQLAHMASAQGVNAVCHMKGQKATYSLDLVPSCVYTSPEIASVGLDEAGAKEKNIPVTIGKYSMAGNGKSIIAGSDLGFIKIVSHESTGEILGAQLMCERATDMIVQFSQLINSRTTVDDALAVIYPHPTYSEGIYEALESTHGQAIHVMPAKKKK